MLAAVGDVAVFDLESGKIKEIIKQEKGAKVIIIKGNNRGSLGSLEGIKLVKSPEPNIVEISTAGRKITLPIGYIFAVGKTEPVIALGEEHE